MPDKKAGAPRVPTRDEITEIIGFLPLISTFFSKARADMPAAHEESFIENGLTARHGAVCVQLVPEPALSVGEVATRMGLALSTVSELVGDLDRAGWIERGPDPTNRRRTLVSLRPERREHMETFVARRAEPLLSALGALTPAERDGFSAGLRAWAQEIRARRM